MAAARRPDLKTTSFCALATACAVGALTLAISAGGKAAQTVPDDLQTQVNGIFKQWTATSPGCAVGASVNGRTVVRSAYGLASLEHDVPNTPETIFDVGSIAKQFTATAVLLLARDGKLSLDDPIRKYVPELPSYGTEPTIRQMLNHTSGLRDWSTLAGIAGWPRTLYGQRQAHILDTPYGHGDVQRLDVLTRQRSLNFTPGSRVQYVNSGYLLAATIVTRISGTSFAEFTRQRIFGPLGMKNTSWQEDYTRIVKRRATGYTQRSGTFVADMAFVVADGHGGLLTTVDDLLIWNENLSKPTVGDAALTAALETQATFGAGRTHEFALGLVVDTYKGVKEVDHSGGAQGYRAHLARYPDQRVSIAVLCNVATANPTAYAKGIADVLLRESFPAPAPAAAPSAELTAEDFDGFAGLYKRAPEPGALAIVRDRRGLSIDGGSRLVPISRTSFVASDGTTFEFDGRNRIRAVDEFGAVDVFDRVEPAALRPEQLQGFTGHYTADEIEARFEILITGGQLAIRRRPDTIAPLTPVYADAFASPLGFVVFQRNATGRLTGFDLTQSGVWNLRFDRTDGPLPP